MKSIDKEVLRLAVPSIISNITVPLLGLVDLAIAGHMAVGGSSGQALAAGSEQYLAAGSEQYLAAVSVGSMIFNLLYWLMGFLRMGTSGMTSQAYGAGDGDGIRLLLRRSLTIALVIAGAFVVLQWPLREVALQVIHPSDEVWPLAATYFDIVIWGAPAMLSLYSLNGWFIGMQDTRVPMVVAIVQNVVNIIASTAFVFGLGLRIEGIALGTLVAQWSGLALALLAVRRRAAAPGTPQSPSSPSTLYSWGHFFTVNRDIFLRSLCLMSVNLVFTSAGARQGDMMLAVNTLLLTFYTLFSYVMDGFAFAGEALSGKYYGAKDAQGLRTVIRSLMRHWGLPLALLFTAAYVFGGGLLLHLLTSDASVVVAAGTYSFWTWLIPLAGFAAFVYDGIFIGLTATRGMLVSSFTATLTFFAVLALALVLRGSVISDDAFNHGLWLAFILYLAMRGLMQYFILKKQSFVLSISHK